MYIKPFPIDSEIERERGAFDDVDGASDENLWRNSSHWIAHRFGPEFRNRRSRLLCINRNYVIGEKRIMKKKSLFRILNHARNARRIKKFVSTPKTCGPFFYCDDFLSIHANKNNSWTKAPTEEIESHWNFFFPRWLLEKKKETVLI